MYFSTRNDLSFNKSILAKCIKLKLFTASFRGDVCNEHVLFLHNKLSQEQARGHGSVWCGELSLLCLHSVHGHIKVCDATMSRHNTEINQCNLTDCLHSSCLPTTSHLGCGITRLLLCSATLSVWLYCTGEASHETLRKILEVYNQHLCSSLFQLHHASQLAWQDRLCCRVQLHPQRILQCLCPQQSGHFRKVSPVRCTITCTVYYSAN